MNHREDSLLQSLKSLFISPCIQRSLRLFQTYRVRWLIHTVFYYEWSKLRINELKIDFSTIVCSLYQATILFTIEMHVKFNNYRLFAWFRVSRRGIAICGSIILAGGRQDDRVRKKNFRSVTESSWIYPGSPVHFKSYKLEIVGWHSTIS